MSKNGKKNVLSRVLTGTVVTACAASAIFSAGGSAVPFAVRADQGGITRAAVTRMLAEEPRESNVKVEGLYTQLQTLPGGNYGINLMLAVSGQARPEMPAVDANTANQNKVLLNGKPMWGGAGGVYFNWDYHWGNPGHASMLAGFSNLDGTPYTGTFDKSLNMIMINGSTNAMNFSKEGNDVITLTKDFQISLPGSAEVTTLGEEKHFQTILHKNGEGAVDGIAWKEIDTRIVTTKNEQIFTKSDVETAGANWQMGGLVDTTYEGNANEESITVRTNDAGHLNLLNADEDAVDISTEAGWKPSGGMTQVKMQRALSFWVYTTVDRTKFTGLNHGVGLSSYDYSAETDAKEFRWNATDIFADSSTLTVGKWNYIVLKFGEVRDNAMNDENAQDQLRYAAMKYFRMYWVNADGTPVDDLAKEDGIYFSDFRLIETPSQTQIGYETAKVKQYVEPTYTRPAVGGARQEINLGLTTRLLNTPGVGEDKIMLTSSDNTALTVEKDTDGKWYATALKPGKVTITASIPGDDRYAASTQTFEIDALKRAQATLTVTSEATGLVDTEYTLTASGGSGSGAVTYELVSGAATLTGDKLTFTANGTVVIKATKAGDTDYEAATSAEFSIEVTGQKENQATLTVSSAPAGYLGTEYTLTSAGGSGSGAVTYVLVSGPAALNGDKLTFSGVGEVVIKAQKAGDHGYNATESAAFTITVSKAIQDTLTVNSAATGTYGTEYTLSATGGSGEGALTYEVVSGPATAAGNKLTFSKAGTVVVKAKKAGDETHKATESATFTITVAKKAITVQISDFSVNVNTQLPPVYGFELAEGSAWAAGDSKSSIALSYSTSADIAKAGEYDLTATLTANDKYDVTILKGKLTVKGEPAKKGCGGAIGAGSAIAGVAALALATGVVLKRKRREEK